jgi:hypothetical protein
VSEGARVAAAVAALERADVAGFGTLMDASHASLRDDYDVSSRELDRLVEIAREGGAAGARLTGAGFGGCIVVLAEAGAADAVLATPTGSAGATSGHSRPVRRDSPPGLHRRRSPLGSSGLKAGSMRDRLKAAPTARRPPRLGLVLSGRVPQARAQASSPRSPARARDPP